jgi:hypothetical protein
MLHALSVATVTSNATRQRTHSGYQKPRTDGASPHVDVAAM